MAGILGSPRAFVLIFAGGILLRLAYAAHIYPNLLPGDAHFYWLEAQNWLDGKGLEFYWPPGLIALLLPFAKIPLGSLIFSMLIWCLFALGWEKAGAELEGWKRNLGQLIWAIFPAFVHQSVVPLSHLPVAAGLLWLIFLLMKKTAARLFLAALLFGYLGLIRPGVWALLPLFAFILFEKKIKPGSWTLVAMGFILLPLCWEVYAHQQLGRWIRINEANAYNLYLGNHPQADPYRSWWLGSHDVSDDPAYAAFQAERDSIRSLPTEKQSAIFQKKAWSYIKGDPINFVLRTGARFRNFWAFDTLASATLLKEKKKTGYLSLPLDAIFYLICLSGGIWAVMGGKHKLLAALVLYQIPYLLAFAHPTYHLPLLPLMLGGLLGSSPTFSRKKITRYLIILSLFLLIQLEWGLDLLSRNHL